MAVKNRPTQIEEDLEATAELPVIDFTAGAAVEVPVLPESAINTDVFPAPAIQVGAAELADSLREVEQRLQRKQEKVAQLEGALAAEKARSTALEAQLAQGRGELAAAGQRQLDLERELAGLKDMLAEARAQLQSQREVLGESQRDAEQRMRQQQYQERDLAEFRRRSERQLEALSTWQGFRAVSESMLGEAEEALRTVEARHAASLGEATSRDAEAGERLASLQQSLAEV